MARSDLSPATDGLTVDRAASRLGLDRDDESLVDVARAALEAAGESAERRYGREATVVGAVLVAGSRLPRFSVDAEFVAEPFDVGPGEVLRAADHLRSGLSPPAPPAEIRSLLRSILVAYELLEGLENGSTAGFQLPGSYLEDAAAHLTGRAELTPDAPDASDGAAGAADPIEPVDEDALRNPDDAVVDAVFLRRHLRRLERDLELARLGTDLYAALQADEPACDRNCERE
ncbi:hypothetical protein ACFQGT_06445 [Natrialbaceae archaeon GCM10025810]|uniref:hypothetical protein n=1 Tax=Halovalidus salilacus TaxID=3075124 RepID=UPI003620DE2B